MALRLRVRIRSQEIQYKINLIHETRKSRNNCVILKVNHKVPRSSYRKLSEKVINKHRSSFLALQQRHPGFPTALSISHEVIYNLKSLNVQQAA